MTTVDSIGYSFCFVSFYLFTLLIAIVLEITVEEEEQLKEACVASVVIESYAIGPDLSERSPY